MESTAGQNSDIQGLPERGGRGRGKKGMEGGVEIEREGGGRRQRGKGKERVRRDGRGGGKEREGVREGGVR